MHYTVKQISDNEIYLLIKYIKSLLWRVAKRLSYIQDAWCPKVNWRVVWYLELSCIQVNMVIARSVETGMLKFMLESSSSFLAQALFHISSYVITQHTVSHMACDTRSNTIKCLWIIHPACNAWAPFTIIKQFPEVILKRNCGVHRLFICWDHYRSRSVQHKLTQVWVTKQCSFSSQTDALNIYLTDALNIYLWSIILSACIVSWSTERTQYISWRCCGHKYHGPYLSIQLCMKCEDAEMNTLC